MIYIALRWITTVLVINFSLLRLPSVSGKMRNVSSIFNLEQIVMNYCSKTANWQSKVCKLNKDFKPVE